MREQEDPTIVRESWLTEQSMSNSDYKALVAFLRYTPWGENWGGEQAYSRAPGLSLEELDRAWQLERWRFAGGRGNEYGTKRYGLPSPVWPIIMSVLTLFTAYTTVDAWAKLGLMALVMPGLVALGFFAGTVAMWWQYMPYYRAKQAYEQRRAALLAGKERAG